MTSCITYHVSSVNRYLIVIRVVKVGGFSSKLPLWAFCRFWNVCLKTDEHSLEDAHSEPASLKKTEFCTAAKQAARMAARAQNTQIKRCVRVCPLSGCLVNGGRWALPVRQGD